jgi:mannose-6-phosphate isomerase
MATSDNVVRAGLTPKLKDVPTLVSMLTYTYGPVSVLTGAPLSPTTRGYDPPIAEFTVWRTLLAPGAWEAFAGVAGPSILLVLEGEGVLVGRLVTGAAASGEQEEERVSVAQGGVYFLPAGVALRADAAAAGKGLTLFRAFCAV